MRRRARTLRPALDSMEGRILCTVGTLPQSLPGPPPTAPITASQWLGYYGLNNVPVQAPGGGLVPATGQGETVVIVSIYRDPSYLDSTDSNWMQSGLAAYSQAMGLNTNFGFTMVNEEGDANYGTLPPAATNVNDAREFDLDTQTIHTIAPQANIIDIVANSSSVADRLTCFQLALQYHPAVISMSFSWTESPTANYQAWSFQGGLGTTIVESAGDSGAGMQYMGGTTSAPTDLQYQPIAAQSPQTVMVGGSQLNVSGTTITPIAWGDQSLSYLDHNASNGSGGRGTGGGTGGGYSLYEPQPAFQALSPYVQQNVPLFPAAAQGMRLGPDLAMESKPGIEVLTDYKNEYVWTENLALGADPIGGTSLAAPTFAGAMALVAQGRAAANLLPLSSIDTLNFLYQAPRADFVDITQGNNGYPALPGFDLASGLGSPTPALWTDLIHASYATTATVSTAPPVAVAGRPATLTATVAATGATPTGTVTFLDNGLPIGSAPLDSQGQATLTFSPAVTGPQVLTAVYDGQGLFSGSVGASPIQVVPMPTATSLTLALPRPHHHHRFSLIATVSAADPTPAGVVVFAIGHRRIGRAPVGANGQATLTRHFPRQGRFRISANFEAQVPFASSESTPLRVRMRPGRVRILP